MIIYDIINYGINQLRKIDEPYVTTTINLNRWQGEFTPRNRFRGGPFWIFWPWCDDAIDFVRVNQSSIVKLLDKNRNCVHFGIQ